jgi:P4 family phage/plasmid primase-like protien
MSRLTIPQIPDDIDLLRAALLYAADGWYVGPLLMGEPDPTTGKRPNAKNPGSILGKRWQSSTSCDSEQIVAWFAGTAANGLFLHVGRSGGVVFDVDHPDLVPEVLAKVLWKNWDDPVEERLARVPYQSTRPDQPGRGHYLILQPLDRVLGNGHGDLGTDWGEVRGNNGIIVVEPTQHESDGLYRWEMVGVVPSLDDPDLNAALPSVDASKEEVGPASDERVEAFWAKSEGSDNSNLMKGPLREFEREVSAGASRHDTACKHACQLMREGLMGYYSAREAANELFKLFNARLAGTPGRFPGPEFKSIIAWAVGQAETIDVAARRKEMDERLAERDRKIRAAKKPTSPFGPHVEAVGPAHVQAMGGPAPRTDGLDPDPLGLLKHDPEKYFQDKSIGLNVEMLASDVLDMGPLARGRDEQFWEYQNGVWRMSRFVIKNRCVALLGPRYRQAHAANCIDVVGARVPEIGCDPVSDYFNCRNGMYNWRKDRLEPHDPGYFSTVQFPWDWDEDGVVGCPQFDEFIGDVLTEDYAQLCWEMIGYLLYSGNPRQRAFLLRGEGGEGKGTLLRVLIAMLGKQNVSTESLTSLNVSKFSAVNLFGKIANIAGDIENTFQTETNMFKALTGEDMIGAEHKYGGRFNFSNWAVPVFSANKVPGSADVTKGYLRRWMMIKFNPVPEGRRVIIGYSDTLIPEIPGIMRKAVGYLRKVMGEGFKEDGQIAEGLEEFAQNVDQARLWLEECCDTSGLSVAGQPHRLPRSDLYKSYKAWAQDNGNGVLKAHEFFSRLETAGFKQTKINGVRMFEGIRVVVLGMTGTVYDKSMPDQGDELVDRWSTTG